MAARSIETYSTRSSIQLALGKSRPRFDVAVFLKLIQYATRMIGYPQDFDKGPINSLAPIQTLERRMTKAKAIQNGHELMSCYKAIGAMYFCYAYSIDHLHWYVRHQPTVALLEQAIQYRTPQTTDEERRAEKDLLHLMLMNESEMIGFLRKYQFNMQLTIPSQAFENVLSSYRRKEAIRNTKDELFRGAWTESVSGQWSLSLSVINNSWLGRCLEHEVSSISLKTLAYAGKRTDSLAWPDFLRLWGVPKKTKLSAAHVFSLYMQGEMVNFTEQELAALVEGGSRLGKLYMSFCNVPMIKALILVGGELRDNAVNRGHSQHK